MRRDRDFSEFLKILRREGKPRYLPFFELLASPGFIARRTNTPFDKMRWTDDGYWQIYVDFWLGMGYDNVPFEAPLRCPLPAGHGGTTEESEARVVFRSLEDYEKYAWPDENNAVDLAPYEAIAKLLPPGVKMIAGVGGGPYEWAARMLGTVGLAYALADEPTLVELVFERLGKLHLSGLKQIAAMDGVGALRQGDDLGFKTSTFISPAQLRHYVFPIYTRMVEASHAAGKPFILHSCGNLSKVYDDLIDTCHIDAKHSFEETITPVEDFKAQYGKRVTPLGGLDVDLICRGTPEEIRAYTRDKIAKCFDDGYWALGTGNSLTNYMPVENYMIVIEEGLTVGN
ncbi:MAG: uroporphyrinogen decarboxylase family protein [Capsulimonadaceae bacterium]|nr:uroporphyrinogen decarboxylase family protein [Capsulimonadaceae bacterium]